MGPIPRFLLFLLRLCPSVTVHNQTQQKPSTPQASTQVPDFLEDLQGEIPDDDLISPSQQRIHYLEYCLALDSPDGPPEQRGAT